MQHLYRYIKRSPTVAFKRRWLPPLLAAFLLSHLLFALVTENVYADSIVYSDSIGTRPTDWKDTLQLPKFDPSLGVLSSVELNLLANVAGTAAFENLGPNLTTVTLTHSALVEMQLPGVDNVLGTPTRIFTATLSPFDGAFDNDGTSGVTIEMEASQLVSKTYTTSDELAAFLGTGMLTIPITATGVAESDGPGNFAVLLRANASGNTFALTYNFDSPDVEIKTYTNGFDADNPNDIDVPTLEAGDPITWTYRVVNRGAIPFTSDELVVADSVPDVMPQLNLSSDDGDLILSPGEEWIYEYVTTAVDLLSAPAEPSIVPGCDPGDTSYTLPTYANTGTVTVSRYNLMDADPTHHCNLPARSLSLQKLINGVDVESNVSATVPMLQPGMPIAWTYVIENTGQVVYALSEIALTDSDTDVHPIFDPTSDADGDDLLHPGEIWYYRATSTSQNLDRPQPGTTIVRGCGPNSADAERPAYQNIASLIADGVVSVDDSYYCQDRDTTLELEKLTNGVDADDATANDLPQIVPGDTVTWTYQVKNTGMVSVVLSDIKVTDSHIGVKPLFIPSSDQGGDGILSPDETWEFEAQSIAQYLHMPNPTVTVVDGCGLNNGAIVRKAYENIGTVSIGNSVDTDPSHYCNPPAPDIKLEKLTNGVDADTPDEAGVPEIAPGETVLWTYLVHNSGNVPFELNDIQVVDSDPSLTPQLSLSSDQYSDQVLSPGETWHYSATGTALDLSSPPANVNIVSGCQPTNLGIPKPVYVNQAIVSAPNAADTETSHYCNPPEPGITIEKMTNGEDSDEPNDRFVPTLSAGDPVTWTYIVENTGNVAFPANEINVTDSDPSITPNWISSSDDGADQILSPGERWYYIFIGTAQDLRQPTPGTVIVEGCDPDSTGLTTLAYQNIATVIADTVVDTDPSHYCESPERRLEIQKLINGVDVTNLNDPSIPRLLPGTPIEWTYVVTNTGTEPILLAELEVIDSDPDVTPVLDPSSDSDADRILWPGEAWRYQAAGVAIDLASSTISATVVQGCTEGGTTPPRETYQNVAVVQAGNAAASDTSYYCNLREGLVLKKFTNHSNSVDPNGIDIPILEPGTPITWTYVVTNTGEVSYHLAGFLIVDSDPTIIPIWESENDQGSDQILEPGETWYFTATGEARHLKMNDSEVTVVVGCSMNTRMSATPTYKNVGAVRAGGSSARDKSHYCNPVEPNFVIEKLTNGFDADDANGIDVPVITPANSLSRTDESTVRWTYLLTNTGSVDIRERDIELTESDTTLTPVLDRSTDVGNDGILAVGEVWTYVAEAQSLELQLRSGDERVVAGCEGVAGAPGFAYRNVVTVNIGQLSRSDPSHYCNATPTSLEITDEPEKTWPTQIYLPLFNALKE